MRIKKTQYKLFIVIVIMMSLIAPSLYGQAVPAKDENIEFLMTFGKEGVTSWGDDDFSQTFFFKIPSTYKEPFYIRVYDPDVGGKEDEINGVWNTRMSYSIYGGKGSFSDPDAKGMDPRGNYKSGTLMASRVFGNESRYDGAWYTFGPFNPIEGEFIQKFDGYIFKIICDGISGDDGNLYRYFLSRDPDSNKEIEGGNAFTYEYSFRMWNNTASVAHIYPFIDTGTISVKQRNFDWDNDGTILVVSSVRKGSEAKISGEDVWTDSSLPILDGEINHSLDIQFHKYKPGLVRNNNVVISVENQYGENLPFFTIPIGGVPVYQGKIGVKKIDKK